MLLGGSWVVLNRVISPLIWVVSMVNLLITLLIATHEPPSRQLLCTHGKASLQTCTVGACISKPWYNNFSNHQPRP